VTMHGSWGLLQTLLGNFVMDVQLIELICVAWSPVCALKPGLSIILCLEEDESSHHPLKQDPRSVLLAKPQSRALRALQPTLQELHNVRMLHGRHPAVPPFALSRFSSLQALTLCRVFGNRGDPAMDMLRRLPVSLQARGRFKRRSCRSLITAVRTADYVSDEGFGLGSG